LLSLALPTFKSATREGLCARKKKRQKKRGGLPVRVLSTPSFVSRNEAGRRSRLPSSRA